MTTKKKMGRPLIGINKEQFEKLCALQCTEEEIANWFHCSIDTINNWCKKTYADEFPEIPVTTFSEVYKNFSVDGKISLRRYQFKMAENNCSMAIWLGKQWLGQKDQQEITLEQNIDDTVKMMDNYFKQKDK